MSFYHIYRPQTFRDLQYTQHQAAEQLLMMLYKSLANTAKNSLPHAYLFTGSHGIGKTSTARILARAINCERLTSFSFDKTLLSNPTELFSSFAVPCTECSACVAIGSGGAVDVVEMDAASHRGIDEIRDLKERITLSPMMLKKKIYIIDEVHMLTTEAFNALLKTLEEPPAHAVFILCTTELFKVPMTIQSRCTHIVFKKPGITEVSQLIQRIAQVENISIDDPAVQLLSKHANGAFRDAVKLLEQLALSGKQIDEQGVNQLISGTQNSFAAVILDALYGEGIESALLHLKRYDEQGGNFSQLVKELVSYCRTLLLLKSNITLSDSVSASSQTIPAGFLLEAIDVFIKALSQQKTTPIASLPLELSFFKLSKVQTVTPVQQRTVVQTQEVVSVQKKKVVPQLEKQNEELSIEESIAETTVVNSTVATVSNMPLTIENMQERWSEVVKLISKYNVSLSKLVSKCKPTKVDGKIVFFETNYTFHKEMVESPKNRPMVEQAIFELFGAEVRIKGLLTNSRVTAKQVENVKEVTNEDLVSVAQEIFGM